MWLKLLSRNSIPDMLKPTFVNGKWRKPILQGKNRAELRGYFERAGVPWFYDQEKEDVQFGSTYNRKPKKALMDNDYEIRIANIRKALSTQDDRLEKLRLDR